MAEGFTQQNPAFNTLNFEGLEELAQQLNYDEQSPSNNMQFAFSRASSTGSVHISSSASSAQNSDDDFDDSGEPLNMKGATYRERRREAHTEAERKRRESIKKGYDDLMAIVPTCHSSDSVGSSKMSKAAILQKSIDYIQHLQREKQKQSDVLEKMEKDVMALKIMKANYEHIVKAHQNTPQAGQTQVSDEVKFQVFQQIMDTLFSSFNGSISFANFAELSGCVFSWLEEYCQPQLLKDITANVLRQVVNQSSRN